MNKEPNAPSLVERTVVSTDRKRAGKAAGDALEVLARELEKDGKMYGAKEVRKIVCEAVQWGSCA